MEECVIRVAPVSAWQEVIELLYCDESAQRRHEELSHCLARSFRGTSSSSLLIEARRHGQLVGAIRGDIQVGNVGTVICPRMRPFESAETAVRLLRTVEGELKDRGSTMLQALLPPGSSVELDWYVAAGYQSASDLLYLASGRSQLRESPPNSDLEFEVYQLSERARLATVLEASYRETLDFPQLNDRRPIGAVMDGYMATGTFSPDYWWFVRHDRHDVGCVLINRHPDLNLCELVYMGLVPAGRGRNWGSVLVHHALWVSRCLGADELYLGVDASNDPAIRTYARAGFIEFDRRHVFFRFLECSS